MAIRVLIVCPHFPPVNRPDAARVLACLRHFQEADAQVEILTVDVDNSDAPMDERLLETLSTLIPIHRVSASRWWKRVGVRDVGIRGFRGLYAAGLRILRQHSIDVVLFSTTAFFSMPLGRFWKSRTGIPYVLDIQDPWYAGHLQLPRQGAWKRRLVRRLHRHLERWTMHAVSGLISVSNAYIEELKTRHTKLSSMPSKVLPFPVDAEMVANMGGRPVSFPWRHAFVLTGRGGDDLRDALSLAFSALGNSTLDHGIVWVGSSYQSSAQPQFLALAENMGVAKQFLEYPERVPMADAMATMKASTAVLVLGSEDLRYNPSKIASAIVSGRPVIAIFPQSSPVCAELRNCGCHVVSYSHRHDDSAVAQIAECFQLAGYEQLQPAQLPDHLSAAQSTRQLVTLLKRVVQLSGQKD